jgi:hypothetical protein
MTFGKALALSLGLAIAATVLPPTWGETPGTPAPEPGKALVYFIRPGHLNGAAGSVYVFADKTVAAVLGNGTYGYAQLEPGRRLFWTTWVKATRELDLVPGETYYLDVWREIVVVDPAQGRALIEKVHDLSEPDQGDREKAASYIDKKYGRAVEKEAKREKAPIAAAESATAAAPEPETRDGMVRIPAYTQGLLEFMETVTSEFSPTGTPVAFRLVEDVVVDGETIAHAGSFVRGVVRQSSHGKSGGKAGVLEVVIPSLKTEQGEVVPLVAQEVGSGTDHENAAQTAGLLGGILGVLLVHGREAFYLAGDRLKVWTREDAWVRRRTAAPADADGMMTPSAVAAPSLALSAHVEAPVYFKPAKGYKPDDVVVIVETAAPLGPVSIGAVGDFALPEALAVKHQVHRDDGVHCTFDGWGVVRFLRAGKEATPQPLHLAGHLTDGRAFIADATVTYEVLH